MNRSMDRVPPDYILRFLRWFCPEHLLEEIEGDLIQKFEKDVKLFGINKARRRFAWKTIRFMRPGIIFRNKFSFDLINTNMIRNYLTIAFRNFNRQRSYTLLNVIGLSLGMAASLLIIQYVKYERSFDRFHSRADDIYRIQYNGWKNGELNFESAVAVPAASAALKSNFPEVEAYTRFLPTDGVITYEKPGEEPVTFREEKAHFADTALFKVFDFTLLDGDPETCLKGTNKIIISESTARKYFEDEEAIGKRLVDHGQNISLEVTGVFRDVPESSHIKFDLLVSYETINAMTNNESETSWGWYDFYSFVLLKPGTDVNVLQAKWDEWLEKNRREDWGRDNKQEFILRPLTDIHLYSNLLYETSPEDLRDGDSVYALSIISVFILIIAWVNYINLATARSFKRANEVGVRKVVGAFRGQLISQFFTESFLLNLFSAILAVLIVRLLWPSFSALTGWDIPLNFILEKQFWLLVISLFLLGTILSGFYPAIILSSFKPVSVLKGKFMKSSGGNILRKGLVVFQFAASVFLISGAVIVYQQLRFMKDMDLGVNINETLVLKGPVADSLYEQKFEAFKTEILRIPGIHGITASSSIPGKENYWTRNVGRLSDDVDSWNIVTHAGIDHDFIPQYGIKVIAGRNFDKRFPDDDDSRILINESLCKALRFKEPELAIGEKVVSGRDTLEVAGVIADFHQMSLKAKLLPVAYRLFYVSAFYSIKLETANYKEVIESIDGPWITLFPGSPVEYFFLDQFFNRQYERDDRFSQVFTLFTVLAIFIASLGLLGLASFMALQRTKEIGIRKVLGASASGIVGLLSRGFMKPVLLAIVIACPLGWWLMDQWLQSFPYRIMIEPWVFLISGMLVLLIAFISVSSQTLKAAVTKPSETLKYE